MCGRFTLRLRKTCHRDFVAFAAGEREATFSSDTSYWKAMWARLILGLGIDNLEFGWRYLGAVLKLLKIAAGHGGRLARVDLPRR